MKAYPAYVQADSPWLDLYPDGWGEARFRHHAVINGGQVDPREPPWSDMVLVAPNHIESGTGKILKVESAAEQGADSGKYKVDAGQVMYSKIRPALNKVATAMEDCLCSADMYAMSFSDQVHTPFAVYFMLARPFLTFATVTSMRVKMPKINREDLADAPWLVPPLAEQRAIADYLDRETARIDTLIEEQQQLVEMLRERRHGLVDHGVFGSSDEVSQGSWQPSIGRHRAVEPCLARCPSEWRTVRFKAVMDRLDDRNDDLSLPMMSLKSSGHVVPRGIGRQEPDDSSLPRYFVVRRGDLVVNPMWLIGGAIGVSDVDGAVSPDYRVFRSKGTHHPRYLHHLLRSRPYIDQYLLYTRAQTTFDRRVQQHDLDNLPMPVPPRDAQATIAKRIDEQTEKIDTLISETERFIELSRERRSALITVAVTGQIDVRNEVD